jgi:hypothetical protein
MEGMRDSPEGTLMSAFAQTLCQRCGARAEEPIFPGRSAVDPCSCGGVRQVIRIIHHGRGEPERVRPARTERAPSLRAGDDAAGSSPPALEGASRLTGDVPRAVG